MPHTPTHKKKETAEERRLRLGIPKEEAPVEQKPSEKKPISGLRQSEEGRVLTTGGKSFIVPQAEIQQLERQKTGVNLELQAFQAQQEAQVQQQAVTTAQPTLEQAGAFEQVTPAETSLQPQKGLLGDTPILGASFAASTSALAQAFPLIKGEGATTGEAAFPSTSPETIREKALRQIKVESFNEGISTGEAFGSFVESIPLVGSRARAWADGLIEQPSTNAKQVIDEINKIKEAASTGQEKVRNGLEDPDFGLDRARSMEEGVAKLEGRLRLLIDTSAVLRANTDEVNKIQEGVLEAREKIARYRQASSFGLTAQLTGTGRPIPTDEQILIELERQNNS